MTKFIFLSSLLFFALVSTYTKADEYKGPQPPPPPKDAETSDVAPPPPQPTPSPKGAPGDQAANPPADQGDPKPPADAPKTTSKVTGGGTAGYSLQTATGSGVAAQGDVKVTKTDSDGSTNGYGVATKVVAGATSGPTQLPTVKVEAKGFWGIADVLHSGTTTNNFVLKGTFDRDVAMNRPWAVIGAGGLEGLYETPTSLGSRRLGYTLLGEVGAGGSTVHTIPFVQIKAGGTAEECLNLAKTDKHQLCGTVDAAAALGLVQVGLGLGAGAQYRYKVEDGGAGKSKLFLVAGPSATTNMLIDVDGVHNANQFMFNIGVIAK